ncbi:MAG: hypothetical protein ACEPOV_11275 [Hyphomicrobiales bacterium]
MTNTEMTSLFKLITADIEIIRRKTDLWELDYCNQILHDIKLLIEYDYLSKISAVLLSNNAPIKVKQFSFMSTTRDKSDRPGTIDWEENEGDKLTVILSYTPKWHNKSSSEKERIESLLQLSWSSTSINTNFPHLKRESEKNYTKDFAGINRVGFQ